MHLTPQDMADIYSSLTAVRAQNRGAENRRASRLDVQAAITLWPMVQERPGPKRTGLTRDLSLTGISLLLSFPLAADQQFILLLPRQGSTPKLLLCCVRHARQPAENLFFIGAEFVTAIDKQHSAFADAV